MKMTNSFLYLLLSVALISVSCVSKKSFDALQAEKDDLAMKLEQLQKDLDETTQTQQAELASLRESNTTLTSQKNALDAELAKTRRDLETKLTDVQTSVDDKQRQLDQLRSEINSAFADVETAVTSSNQRITEIENFLYLDLDDEINFRSGASNVDPSDRETLQTLADMLKNNPNVALIIEGHTDSRSINTDRYQDNWDLSVARATAVVRKLIGLGVNPEQLIASGRSQYMPEGDNASRDGRATNRRTEAILVPNIGRLYRVFKDQNK